MNHKINLSKLNDKQKIWLTQLSYLNLNKEGITKVCENGLTISELYEYLENPTAQMYGNVFGKHTEEISKAILDAYLGRKDGLITKEQLLKELQSIGLGNIKITDIENNRKTGFQAIAFEDDFCNKGISYRGSDCEWEKGGLADWIIADLGEFLTNNSKQARQAIIFFNKNKSVNNYIYGHSLGGNLTSHTYLKHHNEIKEAFSFNGLPVNQSLLDTKEKVDAFNDHKFNCVVVGGDIFQHTKNDSLYSNKVKFIKNNNEGNQNWLSAHLPQSCTYDNKGNFKIITREEATKEFSKGRKWFVFASNKINTLFGNNSYEIIMQIKTLEEKISECRKKLNLEYEKVTNKINNIINKK